MINDVAKKSISDKLIKAMDLEKLTPKETAEGFGFNPCYISMIKNKDQWDKCPNKAWEAVLAWVNSGDTLHHYFSKHSLSYTEGIIPYIERTKVENKAKEEQGKSAFKQNKEGEIIMNPELQEKLEFDSIRDPLDLITSELDKANRALEKSTRSVFNHEIDIELHLKHVRNLIPKIQKLQDAIDKLTP